MVFELLVASPSSDMADGLGDFLLIGIANLRLGEIAGSECHNETKIGFGSLNTTELVATN